MTPVPDAAPQLNVAGDEIPVAPFAGEVNVTAVGAELEILSVTVDVFVPEALLPVMVNTYEPGAAEPVFVIVSTLVPTGVTVLTEKEDVAPAGTPETDKLTGVLYPPIDPILISNVALDGWQILTVVGLAVNV